MKKEEIHIGELIRNKMKEMNIRPAELAKRLGYSLPGVSGKLNRSSMQIDVLVKICKALGYDFFKHYADCPEPISDDKEMKEANTLLQKELTESGKENAVLKLELEYLRKIVRLHEEKGK